MQNPMTPQTDAPSSGGWLGVVGIIVGIVSIMVSALYSAGAISNMLFPPSPYAAKSALSIGYGTDAFRPIVLLLIVPPAISFLCGLAYRLRAPKERGWRQRPLFIGCLAFALWMVLLVLASI